MRPNGELPSDPQKIDRHRQTLKLCRKKAPVAVHHRSACSGVKALQNTSVARRQAAKLCYRFGPLTPSARSGSLIAGDGTKNGLSRSEQKTVSTTQNNRLTGKAPYKFESISLQRRVRCEPQFSGQIRLRILRTGRSARKQLEEACSEAVIKDYHQGSGMRRACSRAPRNLRRDRFNAYRSRRPQARTCCFRTD